MGIIEWATSPWGQTVPIHIAWFLIWVAAILGLLFLIVHAIYVRYFAKAEAYAGPVPVELEARLPERIARHSLAARLFHLSFTSSMPRSGWTSGRSGRIGPTCRTP